MNASNTITRDGPIRATITQIEIGELWRPKGCGSHFEFEIIDAYRCLYDGLERIFVEARMINLGVAERLAANTFIKYYEPIPEP